MIQFDPITFVLLSAGFLMVCAGLKKLAEAHRILKETDSIYGKKGKEKHD